MDGAAAFVAVQKVYYPLLCIMGIPANLFTFYLIRFHKCGMSKTAGVYLSCLAVVDAFYLVWVILLDLCLTFLQVRPFWHSYPWCGVIDFLQYGAIYSSAWIVVVFTIERYLALSVTAARPHAARLSCAAIVLSSHLVSVPMNWINEVKAVNATLGGGNASLPLCTYHDAAYVAALVCVASVLSSGVPIVLIVLFNTLVALHLRRSSRLFTQEERRAIRGARGRGRARRTVLLLCAVSAAFALLSLPRFVTYCILRTRHNRPDFDRDDYGLPINVLGDVAVMLQNLSSASNFLLYCVVSRRFRREMARALSRGATRVFSLAHVTRR
ncbi:probable G-protein coupled receptor 139 [Denticeps clupeoides]|uniref:G-protein coupled receptors family 1 profile domain-containing protein n=1 Tax=Denticeps clupeoides TaxID=299321 RepID=A0AAY4C276_9TELE|nr:probable G-protein coupled receptor 139 [Denticeps clupeoides]